MWVIQHYLGVSAISATDRDINQFERENPKIMMLVNTLQMSY
jgi:hypothetical protein